MTSPLLYLLEMEEQGGFCKKVVTPVSSMLNVYEQMLRFFKRFSWPPRWNPRRSLLSQEHLHGNQEQGCSKNLFKERAGQTGGQSSAQESAYEKTNADQGSYP